MGDYARGRLDLDDEERLPWLEPAIEDEEEQGLSPLRLLGFILFGLVLIGAVVAGVWLIQNRTGGAGGEGKLIAAPAGDYKIPAKEADAKKFDGEGDARGQEHDRLHVPERTLTRPVVDRNRAGREAAAVPAPTTPRRAKAFDEFFAEVQFRGVGAVTGQLRIDELAAEKLV